jgi:hypothetical protein
MFLQVQREDAKSVYAANATFADGLMEGLQFHFKSMGDGHTHVGSANMMLLHASDSSAEFG